MHFLPVIPFRKEVRGLLTNISYIEETQHLARERVRQVTPYFLLRFLANLLHKNFSHFIRDILQR